MEEKELLLLKEKIEKLISKDKMDEAIEGLLSVAKGSKHGDLVLLQKQNNKRERDELLGLDSMENLRIRSNRLSESVVKVKGAVFDLLQQQGKDLGSEANWSSRSNSLSELADKSKDGVVEAVGREVVVKKDVGDFPTDNKWWRWVVALGVLISIPAGIAQFTGYSLKDICSPPTTTLNKQEQLTQDLYKLAEGYNQPELLHKIREDYIEKAKVLKVEKGVSTFYLYIKDYLDKLDSKKDYFPFEQPLHYEFNKEGKVIILKIQAI